MNFRTILCLSNLRIDATSIGALFRETRTTGNAAGLQGAIVSDGERVVHFLHGAPMAVMSMFTSVRTDARFVGTTLMASRDMQLDKSEWPTSGWKAGWATIELMDAILTDVPPGSLCALAPKLLLLRQCDLL